MLTLYFQYSEAAVPQQRNNNLMINKIDKADNSANTMNQCDTYITSHKRVSSQCPSLFPPPCLKCNNIQSVCKPLEVSFTSKEPSPPLRELLDQIFSDRSLY